MKRLLARWLDCDSGATAIEYSLIAVGIAVAIAVIVFTLGGSVFGLYEDIPAAFDN